MDQIYEAYTDEKIFLLQHVRDFTDKNQFDKFVKKNRNQVEQGKGFTRYLILPQDSSLDADPIEFFYLETPNVPDSYMPLHVYGIYDRVTLTAKNRSRLHEDIIKILEESPKFGIYTDTTANTNPIERYTDKAYCANCDIQYPDFTTQHFSPNRQE
jgi:excinuclease UvrABC ATPase subunit